MPESQEARGESSPPKKRPTSQASEGRASEEKKKPEIVYVINERNSDSFKINRKCPRCGNSEAYKVVLSTQGEHAGVKQDRTLTKYTCTKCGHTWTGN